MAKPKRKSLAVQRLSVVREAVDANKVFKVDFDSFELRSNGVCNMCQTTVCIVSINVSFKVLDRVKL